MSNPDKYNELLKHAASCTHCKGKLQDLQEAEELERSKPKPVKVRFTEKERKQR